MASSFIHKGELGFWANDVFVEAMQLCLIDSIEQLKSHSSEDWLETYKIELALQALPMIHGGMSMEIETFLTDESKTKLMILLIENILQKIQHDAEYLTGKTLHIFRKRAMQILWQSEQIKFKSEKDFQKTVDASRWKTSEIHTKKQNYIRVFERFKQLLKGEGVSKK